MSGDLPRIGSEVAGYRLIELVARGGMAVVYLAEDLRLGRKVALKILAAELAEDDDFRARFLRESRTAASIDHPNVIPIYDAGESEGHLYIAMRHVDDTDLKGLLKAEPKLEVDRAISIAAQIAAGLGAAHKRDLVHRDVKPANVLLIRRTSDAGLDHVYLSDFGLAKHTRSVSGLTATGLFMGTVNYAAPEQVQGKGVDGRTDIYALGCLLFECLTGMPPFAKEEGVAVIMAQLQEQPVAVDSLRPDCPPALAQIVAKTLEKAPDDRYQTCDELIDALRRATPGPLPMPSEVTEPEPEEEKAAATAAGATLLSAPSPERIAEETPEESPEGRAERRTIPGGARAAAALALAALAAVAVFVLASGGDDGGDGSGGGVAESPSLADEGSLAWEAIEDTPTPRQQAAGAVVDGNVWVIGGLEGEDAATATRRVEAYDPDSENWVDGPDLPVPLHHAVARHYRGNLVVIGGWIAEGADLTAVTSDRVFVLRGGEDGTWKELPRLNHARAAAAAAVVDGELFVVGGQDADGELVPEVERFNGGEWTDVAPIPTPREHLAAASDGTYLYAVGGRKLSSAENTGALERYDPARDTWTELPEMPTPSGSFDATIALGHLIAVGGEQPTSVTGAVQAYDIAKETWSELPSLGTPRHGLTVVLDKSLLYAINGARSPGHAESTTAAEVLDLGTAYAAPPDVGSWRTVAELPTPRQQAAGAVFGGRVWLLGGLTGKTAADATPTTAAYDPAINSWTAGPKLPLPLHHAAATAYGDALVAIGGWIPDGADLTANTSGRVFALRGDSWEELPELIHPRAAAAVAAVGDKLVVVGGQDANGGLVAETEVFDGENWTEAAEIPTPREHLAAAGQGGHVYVLGGRALSSAENSAALERFDPESGEWTELTPMPTATGSFGAAFVGGRLVAVGGEGPTEVIDAVQAYDPDAGSWAELPPMATPRHGLGIFGVGQTLYALGGALSVGHAESTSTAEALDFE